MLSVHTTAIRRPAQRGAGLLVAQTSNFALQGSIAGRPAALAEKSRRHGGGGTRGRRRYILREVGRPALDGCESRSASTCISLAPESCLPRAFVPSDASARVERLPT